MTDCVLNLEEREKIIRSMGLRMNDFGWPVFGESFEHSGHSEGERNSADFYLPTGGISSEVHEGGGEPSVNLVKG